jgi:putative oxidoreductase
MTRTNRSTLNAALWTMQIVLACTFATVGFLKATVPAADLQGPLGLLVRAQATILRPVGIVELVLAFALVVPAGARVLPRLSPFAAACLAAAGLLGAVQPSSAAGFGLALPNLVLVAGAAFVAWGRFIAAPIEPASFGPEPEVVDPSAAARLERNRQRHALGDGHGRGVA